MKKLMTIIILISIIFLSALLVPNYYRYKTLAINGALNIYEIVDWHEPPYSTQPHGKGG